MYALRLKCNSFIGWELVFDNPKHLTTDIRNSLVLRISNVVVLVRIKSHSD